MSELVLKAEERTGNKSNIARRLRMAGRIPCILYGEVNEVQSFSVDAHELGLLLRGDYALIKLSLGGEDHQVIIKDIQYHPVRGDILHVDFQAVKTGHKVTMDISLEFVGEPVGVKIEGGIFSSMIDDISISVLPKNIPSSIKVNIDHLGMGDSIQVKELEQENWEILLDPEQMICRVLVPKVEAEPEEEVEEEEEMAEPEVITAKEDEGEAGKDEKKE